MCYNAFNRFLFFAKSFAVFVDPEKEPADENLRRGHDGRKDARKKKASRTERQPRDAA
jgi:hypothetical protein